MSIGRRIGKAVGSLAAGYSKGKEGEEKRDAHRCIIALMLENPDADEEEIARLARARLAREHSKNDPRVKLATVETVARLQRALAVAALERKRSEREDDE